VYGIALSGVIAALTSLPLVEVDVFVSAPGMVRPATERVALRLPLGGRIAKLLVRDNERVSSGQVLLELATPDLDERLAHIAATRSEKTAALALLEIISTADVAGSVVLPGVNRDVPVDNFPAIRALRQE
jgi:multidrug efflux pump subunit AcrA (membrane-fusion protein)